MQRQITGTLDVRFIDRIQQDILNHRNESEYDVLYLTPVPDSRHNFHVQIEDFHKLDFDNPGQWPQRLLTAYAQINKRAPGGIPFIVNEICKPGCTRDHSKKPLPSASCTNVGAEVATFNPEDDPTGTDCKALQGYPIFFEFINAVMDHF
ncbi:hypothetical protein N7508_006000 [Penicillium antarcticum]|uniref:uncharacterized protein n=1 Tax=Penicillium antarcticum TaxID=416450 RepID=UPI0023838868|nr:uncharacterized protein N7508_006000 [Penicillium antarcticum]KAJ5306985.1 hypothetical protein N7508_006000 [Penicillium antarcticum]